MNIYSKKQYWKFVLLLIATLIGISSLWYTNKLIKELSSEERKKIELWAEGMKHMANNENPDADLSFVFEVIRNNETVPVILADEENNIIYARNLDSTRINDKEYMHYQLESMKKQHEPIEIVISNNIKQYIYYKDSLILTQLFYYPFIQLAVIFLFILVAYFAFSASRRAEQNQVWVGMSKETAHQLGTPISSLLAWVELLKLKEFDKELITEVDKDVKRLETITERFSKIGSAPVLKKENICEALLLSLNYMKSRASARVEFNANFSPSDEILVPVNIPLFDWVIENLIKNSIDAMNGEGKIGIEIKDSSQVLYIDVCDTGKGVQKSKYKAIFNPGFTTKKRGWGLGLSLSKRIIEQYHNGKIFVKNSEVGKGTTIRIVLKK
ncbi:MAG: histidine kinase [Bacteroidetes bacterium GWA2_30_7]|nr:MAG: histidine kinase [Bacteroidetes bacterium GWA2_30_7]